MVYARGSSADQKADLDRQVASGMREPPKTNGSSKKKFAGPDGWVARGYELEATWPADRGTVQGPLELCEVANEGGVLCLELTEALA